LYEGVNRQNFHHQDTKNTKLHQEKLGRFVRIGVLRVLVVGRPQGQSGSMNGLPYSERDQPNTIIPMKIGMMHDKWIAMSSH
jgi:hypothetical protein